MAAFHGDEKFQEIVRRIIKTTGLRVAIETGTYHGDSSLFLSELCPIVYTIEVRLDYYDHARQRFTNKSIYTYHGDSRPNLRKILDELREDAFIFLDAHWQDDWPLHDELKDLIERRNNRKNVIIVDDFDVPNSRMTGSAGGGGSVGDAKYGPRLKEDPTPCSLQTFGKQLEQFNQVWFPSYDSENPGYVIASDRDLTGIADLRRHK